MPCSASSHTCLEVAQKRSLRYLRFFTFKLRMSTPLSFRTEHCTRTKQTTRAVSRQSGKEDACEFVWASGRTAVPREMMYIWCFVV